MAKKLRSFRVLSCTLAALTTIAFIIACGDGKIIEIADSVWDETKDHSMINLYSSVLAYLPSSNSNPPPQSSEGEEPTVSSSDSEEPSSPSTSSWEEPSSASFPTQSSSSEDLPPPPDYPYRVECKLKVNKGTQNVAIPESDWPTVKCIKKADGSSVGNFNLDTKNGDIKWSGDPSWSTASWKNPPAGTYSIRVEIFDDATVVECRKLKADCEGTLTITAPPPPSSTSYTPPPPPSSSSRGSTTPSSSSRASTPSSSATGSGGGGACASGETRGNMCLWNESGACWKLNESDRSNCAKNGWIFQGGDEGATTGCKNGTFICGKDNNPPKGGAASLGCCHWDTETKCWDVFTEKAKTDCSGGANKFTSTKCPDTEGTCPSSIK